MINKAPPFRVSLRASGSVCPEALGGASRPVVEVGLWTRVVVVARFSGRADACFSAYSPCQPWMVAGGHSGMVIRCCCLPDMPHFVPEETTK